MKRGVFFTVDALFAAILIGTALILSSQYFISETEFPQVNYYSKDILYCLSNIKVSEVNDTYIQSLIASGEVQHPNNTVIEQIGEFYVLNKTDLAYNLSVTVSQRLIPERYGFEILVNDESVYAAGKTMVNASDITSFRRLISGIEKYRPIRGATSKVFLESIKRKRFSSYLYFGGFIGQGNISGSLSDIPLNVNLSSMYLEVDSASDFNFYVNGDLCAPGLLASAGTMNSDGYDVSVCNTSIVPGAQNNFSVIFLNTLDYSYLGGGYVRVDYYTDELNREQSDYALYEYVPDVSGIVNIYSSFYVPGHLENISVFLHYNVRNNETNNTFYLTIGNSTVYRDSNFSGEKNHTISVSNITKYMSLSSMDSKTVPYRIGFENVTFGYIYEGDADVAIITDVSGSMDDQMGSNSGGTRRNCNDASYNLSTTTRLSVAKCLDKLFARDILNITGNLVGLVAYSTSTQTARTVYPTTNINTIDTTVGISVPESGYTGNGYTCICCGINSAVSVLMANTSSTSLVASGSSWRYNNESIMGAPAQDLSGNSWFDFTYGNEGAWHAGNAVLGSTNAVVYAPAVTTEIGGNLSGGRMFANLWEHASDNSGPPNDFSSNILNFTANTFGISGANDGWDWMNGTYDYASNMTFNKATGGQLEMYAPNNNRRSSGAYGISVNVTAAQYEMIQSSAGRALLSFDATWAETGSFESSDHIWIKGRWTSPTSGSHYLGSDLDAGMSNIDNTTEIGTSEDPDNDIIDKYYSIDIKQWIEGPGMYYLDLGGKIRRDDTNEDGYFRFDDIKLEFSNNTNYYYFRKNFTITNLSQVRRGVLNVLSDDYALIYLNGILIDDDYTVHEGEYWNRRGKYVSGEHFRLGNNVIAVQLMNTDNATKFDLELLGLSDVRSKAMMVMSDGQANYECTPHQENEPQAAVDAIAAACAAREDYGITVFAVGYSSAADGATLQSIADCGDGIYVKSDNTTVLEEFYQDVASTIVSASRHSQTIELEGNITASRIYGDSYIKVDYILTTPHSFFGEISMMREEKNFGNCSFTVDIPADVRVSDAKLTSYSSEHWTSNLIVNNMSVYNLTEYSTDYGALGDPFVINVPAELLRPGANNFQIWTGDSPYNTTACSLNNSFIYMSHVTASVSYSDVLEKAIGCNWTIEFDEGGFSSIKVPPAYSGTKACTYTNASRNYDGNDTYDEAMYDLLDNLDFDDDGRIYVNIEEHNFVVGAISVGKIPYPWGPAIAEVRVWK